MRRHLMHYGYYSGMSQQITGCTWLGVAEWFVFTIHLVRFSSLIVLIVLYITVFHQINTPDVKKENEPLSNLA